jgi:predicted ester cyclase
MELAQSASTAEQSKTLIRTILEELDRSPSVEVMARWLAPEFTTIVNNEPPIDREAYLGMAGGMIAAFSNIRHEVHEILAEGDRVAVAMTLHLTHTGEYEGLAPTGRSIKVPETSFMALRDGKVVAERVFIDLAGLHQQLTA